MQAAELMQYDDDFDDEEVNKRGHANKYRVDVVDRKAEIGHDGISEIHP